MRYLFVIPRMAINFGSYYTFPLGIAYVSAAMKQAGFEVETLNLNHSPRPILDLLRERIEAGARVVCTGGLSGHYGMVKQILEATRSIDPTVRTVVGGGLLSSEPAVVMEGTRADFGVIGEGEITMVALARVLEARGEPDQIQGLIFRRGEEFILTQPRPEIPDIDALPWPDYDGFELETYLGMIFPAGGPRTMSLSASRSCPFECTFCYHPTGRKYRQRSLDAFFEELDHLVRTYRLTHINIQDELFSVNRARTTEFCQRIKQYGITWDIQLRVDLVTAELLEELKEAGCHYLSLGIESADDGILHSMRKHITREKIERALALTWQANVEIQGNLIFGDEAETMETALNTLAWWREHRHYHLDIFFIQLYPGTHLYHSACRRGLIPDKLKFLEEGCPLINVSQMTEEEFRTLNEILIEHRNAYPYAPAQLRMLDPDDRACCTAELLCRKCGATSRHPNTWIFGTNLRTCPHCRQRHDVEPFTCLQGRHEPVFEALVARGDRLAIWGAGNIANVLLKSSPSLRGADVPLVDTSVSKQGLPLWGHPVLPPSALDERGIDTVIIASVLYREQIAEALEHEHPGVSTVLTLAFEPDGEGGHELRLTERSRLAGNFQRY